MAEQTGLRKQMMEFGELLIQSLYPRRCPVCEEIAKGKYICSDCVEKLRFVREPICMICGKEILKAEEELCSDCSKRARNFEFGRALLCYDEIAECIVANIKYKNKREYVDGLAKLLAYRYRVQAKRIGADCVMPVPIHAKRMRERGFNQAELIAKIISEEWELPLDTKSLVRIKNTKAQKDLQTHERERNLNMAFVASKLPENYRRVILIDDIFTTGSTIEACTKALNQERRIEVYCFCLCIGMENS